MAVKMSLRGPMTITPSAANGTAAAVHRTSRTDGPGSGRTGPAARASCTMSSSVLTPVTSQQASQGAIAAMRGHFDSGLGHAQATGHFTHGLILELQRFNDL